MADRTAGESLLNMSHATPPSSVNWTERDRELVETLTLRVRLISPDQAARTWWTSTATGPRLARRRLDSLAAAGFLRRMVVHAHPELELVRPIAVWSPGEPAPAFGGIAYRLQKRWKQPIVQSVVFVATPRAARLFGGRAPGLKRPLQATHDLHMTTVYLKVLAERPGVAAEWMSEDILAPMRRGEKLPDALVVRFGKPALVVEFGGAYDAERVERVHKDCVQRHLPYELW